MLFLWGPVGLLLFGAGGFFVLRDAWDEHRTAILAGVAAGALCGAALAALVARNWDRRLSGEELADSRAAARNARPPWRWWVYGPTVCVCGAGALIAGLAFGLAFLFAVMTIVTLLGWATAAGGRGLYQAG